MSGVPEIERLSPGYLMAFTADELKKLRGIKGDPARRKYALERKKTVTNTLELLDSWVWLDFMCGKTARPFVGGQRLHKGQMSRLQLYDVDAFVAELNKLPSDEAGLKKHFDGLKEADFHYRYVPFWTANKWKAAGVTGLKTPARRAEVIAKLIAARVFIDQTVERGEQLLFFCDYRQ